jgi:hypothetical protein
MKWLSLGLACLIATTAHGQNANWKEVDLPMPEAGRSVVNWIAYEERGADRSARVEVLRADHFNAEWLSEVTIHVRGSQADGTRQIRMLRQDEGCLSDAEQQKIEASTFCDNLLVGGTDDALQVWSISADADTSFAFELRRSRDEAMVWRKVHRGLRFEPAIAVGVTRDAGDLQASWRVDGDNFSHRNTLIVPRDLQRALGLSDAEAALLGYVELAYAQGDFEGPAPIHLDPRIVEAHRLEVSRDEHSPAPHDPWGACAGDNCAPASEGNCTDFQCRACALRPRGISEKQCQATLYSALGEEAPDVHCLGFICWESGEGWNIGGGGGNGGSGGSAYDAPPQCNTRFQNPFGYEVWQEEPLALPDYVLDVSARKRKPIAIYTRATESIYVANVNVKNESCGTAGLDASNPNQIFFNQQRVAYGDRAWNSAEAYSGAPALVVNHGTCATIGALKHSFVYNVSGMALGNFLVDGNVIPNAICFNDAPGADYPFQKDWRAWIHVDVDPADSDPELSEDNNAGRTRNWVKLRSKN